MLYENMLSGLETGEEAWTDRHTKITVLKIRKEHFKLTYFNTAQRIKNIRQCEIAATHCQLGNTSHRL
jgi:hypothetical protein